jgi:hypothetical protein
VFIGSNRAWKHPRLESHSSMNPLGTDAREKVNYYLSLLS